MHNMGADMTKISLQNKKAESGRSMIEMLGVLAIIGVLSIGGIVAYTYGMTYYRANEIMNEVNLLSVSLTTQISTQGALETEGDKYETEMGDTLNTGHTVEAFSNGEDTFTIYVYNVQNKVSTRLKNFSGGNVEIDEYDDISGVTLTDENHTNVGFTYPNWPDEEDDDD